MELSDNLREFSKEEKSSINNLFERESRRERILSTIQKEEQMLACQPPPIPMRKAEPEEDQIKLAEENYYKTIREERDSRSLKMQKMLETSEKYI